MANKLLYLSAADVASVGITMAEIIKALEQMFYEKGEGRVEMPPKPGIHPMPESFIHAMPALIPASKAAGVKWVSGYPGNFRRGLPYISGLIILNDPETGLPLSVMDCVWITAKRTGAATAVAARYLARPDSEVVGILGCGVEGRSNLEALMELFTIKRVIAYDINPDVQLSYANEMAQRYGIVVIPAHEPREAVAWCDIVVTAGPITKVPHATIQAEWFKPGCFASLVDFDSYWSRSALALTDKFCTDDVPQLDYYRELGYFQDIPPVHAELGQLVTGQVPGRQSAAERTVACNLGLALDDMVTAPLVYRRAMERGIGTWLPL